MFVTLTGKMSRPVTRGSHAKEVNEWEEAKTKLEFTFASRKTLQENGFPGTKRVLSTKRKGVAEGFLALVAAEPTLYGEVGSDKWIQGLLTHLNEPTVLSWDDVTEWLKTERHNEFFRKELCKSSKSSVKRVPVKRISSDEEAVRKDKVPRMKHAILKLTRHDPNSNAQNSSFLIRTVSSIEESDDEHLRDIDTPEFNQTFLEYVRSLDSDYDSDATTDPGDETVFGGMELRDKNNAQNDEEDEDNNETHAVNDAHDVEPPEIIEIPTTPENPSAPEADSMEVNDNDGSKEEPDSSKWTKAKDYYKEYEELLDVENSLDGNKEELLDNDKNNNAVLECQNSNDSINSVPSLPKSPIQLPTESVEVSSQNSNDGVDDTATATITSNETVESVSGSTTKNPETEAVATCSKQSTAPDPTVAYKNCLAKAWAWITNKDTPPPENSGTHESTLCSTCVEYRERIKVIEHVIVLLDAHMVLLYGPDSNLDYGRLNNKCSELYDELNELGKGFQNNFVACDCGSPNNDSIGVD
ncbi:hypothetical protein Ocin01_01811 [Orchesella cincta]|uniref:Uncharacterized protein n=1 Tax=Orchesella cincta TaxID=48709 RepID=A0A1D2NHZ1_ORCCI|nr:hypothetical protein Ocin01_01811 [Orchesella cincta]